MPQPTTPVRPLSLVCELSSSPLSSAPSLPSSPGFLPPSPAYIKTEDDGDETEAGCTKGTSVASTARSSISRRQPGIDECADPEWVAILKLIYADPDVQMTANVRPPSQRIRDSAASKSSHTGASSKISPPSARRRSKRTVKPVKLKEEETGHNLGSPDISEAVEPFSLSAGNGVQQAPLASSRDALAVSKSTLKRKRKRERQNLEDLAIVDSARTVAAIETALACVRAESLPLGYTDKPDASHTGLEGARHCSMEKDTIYVKDQLETSLGPQKPAAMSARRKLGGSKYSSTTNEVGSDESSISNGVLNSSSGSESAPPTDNEDEDYESSSSCEGSVLPNEGLSSMIPDADRFATHEFEGSPKPSGEDISKKQKLNNSQSLALSVTKASGESNELDVRDPRVSKEAFELRGGVLYIPHGCDLWVSF